MSRRGRVQLDGDELAIAELLVKGKTVRAVAVEVGMAYRIVQEIAARPEVLTYVAHEMDGVYGATARALTVLTTSAAAALARNMLSTAPPALQVQSAKIVLDFVERRHARTTERLEQTEPEAPLEPASKVLAGVTDATLAELERRLLGMQGSQVS